MLVGERDDLLPIDGERTDQRLVFTQADDEVAPDASEVGQFPKPWTGVINAIDFCIGDPHKALTSYNLFKWAVWPGQERTSCAEPFGELWITAHGGWVETFAIICAKNAVDRLAKIGRLFEKRVKDRRKIAR